MTTDERILNELKEKCESVFCKTASDRKIFSEYLRLKRYLYSSADLKTAVPVMISELNWLLKGSSQGRKDSGIRVSTGDIVYIDFGQAYQYEMAYQHYGLVISVCCDKAFVVPMTSSMKAYRAAYDSADNKEGHYNLMRIGIPAGLNKPTTLYLNDARHINPDRIICKVSRMDPHSRLFHEIYSRIRRIVLPDPSELN
ncbi:MAG: type II toxin-antitoxin system PemK/MazF family toxin [Solobacterium sp.]|nr:type II toxin-antitoxin system PemK/MazF family toxin [Solobacterium sp.]